LCHEVVEIDAKYAGKTARAMSIELAVESGSSRDYNMKFNI
jgi:hypothetical protein